MTEPPFEIDFRPLTRDDSSLLAAWLARPHVARWWNHDYTPEAIESDFGPSIDGADPTEMHSVLLDGRPIGLGEVGTLPDVEVLADQPRWAWFLGWPEVLTDANDDTTIRAVYGHPRAVTLEDLPRWRPAVSA